MLANEIYNFQIHIINRFYFCFCFIQKLFSVKICFSNAIACFIGGMLFDHDFRILDNVMKSYKKTMHLSFQVFGK